MKTLLTLASLLWIFSGPLSAQTPDSEQTPDVIESFEVTELPTPPSPMSQVDQALVAAAFKGDLAQVAAMITKGADVESKDQKNRTPLIFAASNGHTSVVEFLASKGADVNARDSGGRSALSYASRRSFNETAKFLVEKGAEVNVQSKKRLVTPLMLAAVSDNQELVRLLLEHGADPSLTDIFGRTARLLAELKGNSAVVALLPESPTTESG